MITSIYHHDGEIAAHVAKNIGAVFNKSANNVQDGERDLLAAYMAGRKPGASKTITPAELEQHKHALQICWGRFVDLKELAVKVVQNKMTISLATQHFLHRKAGMLHTFSTGWAIEKAGREAGALIEKPVMPDPANSKGFPIIIIGSGGLAMSDKAVAILKKAQAKEFGEDDFRKISLGAPVTGAGLIDLVDSFGRAVKVEAKTPRAIAILTEEALRRWNELSDFFLQADEKNKKIVSDYISDMLEDNRRQHPDVDFDNLALEPGTDYELIKS